MAVALVLAAWAFGLVVASRRPGVALLVGGAVLEALLAGFLVGGIVQMAGSQRQFARAEFVIYLLACVAIPPAAAAWGWGERGRAAPQANGQRNQRHADQQDCNQPSHDGGLGAVVSPTQRVPVGPQPTQPAGTARRLWHLTPSHYRLPLHLNVLAQAYGAACGERSSHPSEGSWRADVPA
jgi:hypothetical protein